MPISEGEWRYPRRGRADDPAQGWKLHVAATRLTASEVFARVAPILFARDVLFKAPARLDFLALLNAGLGQFSQVGKFLTLYPRSEVEACELARELHAATRGVRAPEIPFDARYRKGSCIYYRYGSFQRSRRKGATIVDAKGKRHADRRAAGTAVPRWIGDPFRISAKPTKVAGPIGTDLLAFKVLSQRGKGGVYEAVDLSVSPARLVIIKEGRRHGETAWTGEDGFARVRHEGRVLRELQKAGVPVPEIFRDFTQNGSRYLVLEKVPGPALLSRNRKHPAHVSWRRTEKLLARLMPILSRIHAAGWVWRDCKPSHIFLHGGEIRLVDFEGACRRAETEVLPWGSMNYSPPIYQTSFARRAGILEDDYALGVIAFQFGAGKFPSPNAKRRAAVYRRSKCPDTLRTTIEQLLRPERITASRLALD